MDSSLAPAAAPASPSRSGRRVLNPPPLSPSSSAAAAAAANSAADKMKGLLIDEGKEKPSCRRRKVREGAAKADVRRRPPGARCRNRKAPSDPSSKPKKPRVSTAVDIPPEWFERCLRLEMEEGDDMGYVPFDYEKHRREEMEKAVAEEVQFVKDGIQRWIDRGFYGIGVRPRKPKEIASDDEYPSGSYSDETLKKLLDFKIKDHHFRDPNFEKCYMFKLQKEHGYSDDRSSGSGSQNQRF